MTSFQTRAGRTGRSGRLKFGSQVLEYWCLALWCCQHSNAQSYSLDWRTMDGGGSRSTNGQVVISGTIGQPDAGGPMTNGPYSVTSGFWALPTATQVTVAAAPEIAVEQPLATNIPDGGSKAFGSVVVGGNTSLILTIKNTGNADLTGLTITTDGADAAMFSVTASPVAPVSGPSGTTTFTVQFAPTSAGAKTAALHITSNDADENPSISR